MVSEGKEESGRAKGHLAQLALALSNPICFVSSPQGRMHWIIVDSKFSTPLALFLAKESLIGFGGLLGL